MPTDRSVIGDIVTADFRTAEIFKKNGIDFCCGGNLPLKDACQEKGIRVNELVAQLSDLMESPDQSGINYNEWTLDFLIDYIINTHHQFVRRTIPQLREYTAKIASVHGDHHPELHKVAHLFSELDRELLVHLQNEEQVLFPAIRESIQGPSPELRAIISVEITRMGDEHEFAGSAMDQIRQLTHDYIKPDDACNTYHLSLELLERFEDDLHIHVHLENNILYKKALEL